MNIRTIQEKLPWGLPYAPGFKVSTIEYKDFQHTLLHVTKATGKLSAIVEDADHGRFPYFPAGDVQKYCADLVICAMRLANTNPSGSFDLLGAVIHRLESKNGVYFDGETFHPTRPNEEERRQGTV